MKRFLVPITKKLKFEFSGIIVYFSIADFKSPKIAFDTMALLLQTTISPEPTLGSQVIVTHM